jgi:hypothetical protein
MWRTNYLCGLVFCSCAIVVLAECNSGGTSTRESSTVVTTSGGSQFWRNNRRNNRRNSNEHHPAKRLRGCRIASLLLLPPFWYFLRQRAGRLRRRSKFQVPLVSVDNAGNIYLLADSNIEVFSAASPLGSPTRVLPVGVGKKISAVADMVASQTGEIFVSDGTGIAVFSPTATADAGPVRYIVGNSQPGRRSSDRNCPRHDCRR